MLFISKRDIQARVDDLLAKGTGAEGGRIKAVEGGEELQVTEKRRLLEMSPEFLFLSPLCQP